MKIEDEWLRFISGVLPPEAPAIQRREMRRAFYAGFASMLGSFGQLVAEMEEDDAVEKMQELRLELLKFSSDIGKGKA